MLAELALAATFLQAQPGLYVITDRVRRLDLAWASAPDERKRQAIKALSEGTEVSMALIYKDAAKDYDEAIAILENRKVLPEDALDLYLSEPIVEPGQPAKVWIRWTYDPESSSGPVTASVGSVESQVASGRDASLTVDLQSLSPELKANTESGYLIPVRLGATTKHVYVSVIPRYKARIEKLTGSKVKAARDLGAFLQGAIAKPHQMSGDLPLVQYLLQAEQLASGDATVKTISSLVYGMAAKTPFRAAFPQPTKSSQSVVIAMHGRSGTRDLWFDAYGRGMAPDMAAKRGWIFMAANPSERAVQDCIDWLKKERGVRLGQVFVLGHSRGGGMTFIAGEVKPRPAAVAALAPAAASFPADIPNFPIYMAVGKQDMDRLRQGAHQVSKLLGSRKSFLFEEFDLADHLMIIAQGLGHSYAFFDKFAAP